MTAPLARLALGMAFLTASAGAASAQHGFVQGSYGTELRRFSAELGEEVLDGRADSLAGGAAAFVTPRVSAGVELDLGGTSSASRTVRVTLGGTPTEVTTTYTLRRRSVAALVGIHTAADRPVRLGVYAGLGFHAIRREVVSDAPPIVVTDPPGPSVFLERSASPVAGADLAIRLAPGVAVVASVRAQALRLAGDLQGFSVRPGGALRLQF